MYLCLYTSIIYIYIHLISIYLCRCVYVHSYPQSQPQLSSSYCFTRPSHNIDCNRNCCTFEDPVDVLSFIESMKKHPLFGGHPVRTKAIICLMILQTLLILVSTITAPLA